MFIDYMKIDVDRDFVLTACLLCNCKKVDNAQSLEKIRSYATEGAEYLAQLGFDKKFCKVCQEVNRYSGNTPREKESDILELIDQFGAMLLDRPERKGFDTDEAMVLIEYRNLKDVDNRYMKKFKEFVEYMNTIEIMGSTKMTALKRLTKIFYESEDVLTFIRDVTQYYSIKVDKLVEDKNHQKLIEMIQRNGDPNRSLFSIDTVNKLAGQAEYSQDIEERFQNADEFIKAINNELKIEDPDIHRKIKSEETVAAQVKGNKVKGPGFAAIAGMQELKDILKTEVIDVLHNPEEYARYGLTIPNGMLLYGPPGCGKTFFAKHLAEEVGFNFMMVTPSTLICSEAFALE